MGHSSSLSVYYTKNNRRGQTYFLRPAEKYPGGETMTTKKIGAQTAALANPPSFAGWANVAGKKEGEGPLADTFDYIDGDDTFGESTWEKSESAMQKQAAGAMAAPMLLVSVIPLSTILPAVTWVI